MVMLFPDSMVYLWRYQQIRSSRMLREESQSNIELAFLQDGKHQISEPLWIFEGKMTTTD